MLGCFKKESDGVSFGYNDFGFGIDGGVIFLSSLCFVG